MSVILHRRGTDTEWTTANTVLGASEIGYVTAGTNAGKIKIGDGVTAWNSLAFYPATGGSASQVKYLVKNSTGSSILKGAPVYISGANGTNMLISPASASSEETSSKTLGLLEEDLIDGAIGYVVVEGLLAGLNTNSATAGQSVWLSATAGQIVYGSAPAEPAHSVYLGVVTRVQQNNGEIFVKVQNGYELDELHDVFVGSAATGDLLVKTSTGWGNKSLANAGVAAATHAHSAADITSGVLLASRGGTGLTVGTGMVPITPTSIGGAVGSISSTGRVSITSGTGFILNGIFTPQYRNYKIIIDHRNMGGAYEYARFSASDNTYTTAGAYYGGGFYRQGAATGIWQNTGDGYAYASIGYTADGGYTMIDVFSPQWNGSYGKMLVFNSYGAGSHTQVWSDWMWNGWDAFSGIYIYNGGANYSAEVEVYGYNH